MSIVPSRLADPELLEILAALEHAHRFALPYVAAEERDKEWARHEARETLAAIRRYLTGEKMESWP